MGRIDDPKGSPEEISADVPSVYVVISKRIKIWDGRQKLGVEIKKSFYWV